MYSFVGTNRPNYRDWLDSFWIWTQNILSRWGITHSLLVHCMDVCVCVGGGGGGGGFRGDVHIFCLHTLKLVFL